MNDLHIVFGTGPVGCWTARTLVDRGLAVRAVNRSGRRPPLMPAEVEMQAADASDPAQAAEAASGAATVYQAMNPPYDQWASVFPALQAGAVAAAKATGATLVSVENLYMYGSSAPITEGSPIKPVSKKGLVREAMARELDAVRASGELRVLQLRSADYYGPGVTASALSEMCFGNLVKGKKPTVFGSPSQPHSYAYIEDVGRAAAELGTRGEVPDGVWIAPHAPALTQGRMAEKACAVCGMPGKVSVISPFMMRLAGMFSVDARESVEMLYEFTEPFIVDSSRIERELGLEPTQTDEGLRRTVEWYRRRGADA